MRPACPRRDWAHPRARPRRARPRSARPAPRPRGPLRVRRRGRHLARRSRSARDPRRRVGGARRRASGSACARSTRSSPTSTASGGSSPRASCPRGSLEHRGGLRARRVRCRAGRRGVDRGRRARPRARRARALDGARGQRADAERDRLLDRGARGDPGAARSAAAPHPIEAAAVALRNVLGPGNAIVLTDGQDNPAYWEHEFLAARMDVPLAVPADVEVHEGRVPPRRHAGRRGLPPHERR